MSSEAEKPQPPAAGDGCPLHRAAQTRNMVIYASAAWLSYLAAPVTYVGVLQASMLNDLGASAKVANLPATAYFTMTFTPLLIAWAIPYVSYLRVNVVGCYTLMTLSMVAVTGVLVTPVSNGWKIGVVIVQAGIMGIGLNSATVFLWELLGRGMAEARRGPTLSLSFGAGPLLAVVGSLVSQGLLTGNLFGRTFAVPSAPYNYALLYAVATPMMGLAAVLACFMVVPPPEREVVREPFIKGVFGGLANFLGDRVLLLAMFAIVLFYTGNTIVSNMNLYTEQALGAPPSQYAGWQNTVRFGVKSGAGLCLGWLLARTSPRTAMLAAATLFVSGQLWAIGVTGLAYLAAFGLYGAGELIGVYGPNYILSASRKVDYRRNMAIITIIGAPTAFAGFVFGAIVDYFKDRGRPDIAFPVSFAACAGLMTIGILIALVFLPARPRPAGAADPAGKHAG